MTTTYMRRLMCLRVAIIASALAAGSASLAAAQGLDRRVPTMTPAQFHSEVQAARASLAGYLSSSQGRPELAMRVRALLDERIKMAPAGDERQNEFPQRLSETFKSFTLALDRLGPEQISNLDLVEFENSSFEAYNHNAPSFGSFVSKSYAFSKVDAMAVLHTSLEFSMALYAADRDQWQIIQHLSHVWPLCGAVR